MAIPKNTSDLKETRTYLGTIVSARREKSKEFTDEKTGKTVTRGTGYQIHIEIRPDDHEVKGEKGTGVYHEWLSETDAKSSKMGLWLEAIEDTEFELDQENKEDFREMEGEQFEFEKEKNIELDGGFAIKDMTLPRKWIKGGSKKKRGAKTRRSLSDDEDEGESEDDWVEDLLEDMAEGMNQKQLKKFARKKGVKLPDLDKVIDKLIEDEKVEWDEEAKEYSTI